MTSPSIASSSVPASTIRMRVNERRLVLDLKFAFGGVESALAELAQNARRAGARRVSFVTDGDNLTVCDDGHGIADFAHLIAVSESGWSEETQLAEGAYGLGLLSALHLGTHIEVISRGHRIAAATADVLAFRDIALERAEGPPQGTCIIVQGCRVPRGWPLEEFERRLCGFPIPVTLNGTDIERPLASGTDGWVETDAGLLFDPDMEEPSPTLFLQGCRIDDTGRHHHAACALHLNANFRGALPDRRVLADQRDANARIADAVTSSRLARLAAYKQTMTPAAFVERWGQAIARLAAARALLTDVEYLPRQWFGRMGARDIQLQGGYDAYEALPPLAEDGVISKAELAGRIVASIDIPTFEDSNLGLWLLLARRDALLFESAFRLSEDHWIHAMVQDYTSDASAGLEVHLEDQKSPFAVPMSYLLVQVVECTSFVLKAGALEARVTDHPLPFWGDGEARIALPPTNEALAVGMTDDFVYDDRYDELAYDNACERFAKCLRRERCRRSGELSLVLTELMARTDATFFADYVGKTCVASVAIDASGAPKLHFANTA